MSRKYKIGGICHICGEFTQMSWEHVPPEKAFNDQPMIYSPLLDAFADEIDGPLKGKISQRGMGAYTLCNPCNNATGSWYGDPFIQWTYQGAQILVRTNYNPKLIYLHYIEPLSVIKQIAVMMFSTASEKFQAKHQDLVKFVKNKELKYLPPRYRFFVYFNHEGRPRMLGDVMQKMRIDYSNGLRFVPEPMYEVTFPPYGYVMMVNGEDAPDKRLVEITHFARYDFRAVEVAPLHLPVLPTHIPIPGDYRTQQEIDEQAARSMAEAERIRRDRLAS